ncbi:MAG: TetR/AcrR family transcriptional regulator [Pseudomonadales bacterium]
MGHSQADKARNRERILTEAAARIRRDGLESVSVAGLMESVGLTHGGFYNHFVSRTELLEEALKQALALGVQNRRKDSGAGTARDDFEAFVRGYLSPAHRDHPESGCAIAALVSEVGHGEAGLKATMSAQVEGLIATATKALGSERDGMLAVSALIGALALSRVCTDRERSDALLRTVREGLSRL